MNNWKKKLGGLYVKNIYIYVYSLSKYISNIGSIYEYNLVYYIYIYIYMYIASSTNIYI